LGKKQQNKKDGNPDNSINLKTRKAINEKKDEALGAAF